MQKDNVCPKSVANCHQQNKHPKNDFLVFKTAYVLKKTENYEHIDSSSLLLI
jgi:hypothetical protein